MSLFIKQQDETAARGYRFFEREPMIGVAVEPPVLQHTFSRLTAAHHNFADIDGLPTVDAINVSAKSNTAVTTSHAVM